MDGQAYDVVHLDGIHLGRNAVVPVAWAGGHVLGWYVARRETSAAWMSLMARIAEPVVVVCDRGGGIRKALRHAWPHARVQRCLLHICPDIGAILGTNPRHEASRQLLRLAKELTHVKDGDAMAAWLGAYNAWELRHKDFLDQKSVGADGSENDLHQRLVKARDTMRRRIRERTMFTFMDPELGTATPVPTTNNAIESVNARIREMLRGPPQPTPDPSNQGRVLVVSPTHRAPRNPGMDGRACVARRADRTTLPTSMGIQRRRTTDTTRHPRRIRNRHRLERIPRRHTMEKHQLARHTFWPITRKYDCFFSLYGNGSMDARSPLDST